LIGPEVEALGYELVGVVHRRGRRRGLLRVYIDAEAGITLDDCTRVSQQVSAILDVEDPVSGEYDLEVSSPGLDRPLFEPAHYERFQGAQVRIRLLVPLEGRRNFAGVLRGCRDGRVILAEDGVEQVFPIDDIGMARLVPDE
jgi:ribosome maturation factor RimP